MPRFLTSSRSTKCLTTHASCRAIRGETVDKHVKIRRIFYTFIRHVKTFTCLTPALDALSLTGSCDLFTMYIRQEQLAYNGEGDFMEERAKNFLNPRTAAKVNTAKNH